MILSSTVMHNGAVEELLAAGNDLLWRTSSSSISENNTSQSLKTHFALNYRVLKLAVVLWGRSLTVLTSIGAHFPFISFIFNAVKRYLIPAVICFLKMMETSYKTKLIYFLFFLPSSRWTVAHFHIEHMGSITIVYLESCLGPRGKSNIRSSFSSLLVSTRSWGK